MYTEVMLRVHQELYHYAWEYKIERLRGDVNALLTSRAQR